MTVKGNKSKRSRNPGGPPKWKMQLVEEVDVPFKAQNIGGRVYMGKMYLEKWGRTPQKKTHFSRYILPMYTLPPIFAPSRKGRVGKLYNNRL